MLGQLNYYNRISPVFTVHIEAGGAGATWLGSIGYAEANFGAVHVFQRQLEHSQLIFGKVFRRILLKIGQ